MNYATNFSITQPKTAYHPVFSQNEITEKSLHSYRTKASRTHHDWHTLEATTFRVLGYASVLVVPLILAIWLSRAMPDFQHLNIFQSVPIGGSLTLNQAKAVDFVSSAVFAPLILAVFNCAWFANARVSIADERTKQPQGTSLYALVEASSISSGSYDLIKIWALATSRSVCLIVFAILTLAAAMGKSSLSNFIAYEAYKRPVDAGPVQLRLLTGPYMASYEVNQTTNNMTWLATHDQRKDFAHGTTEVLQGITWQNSTDMLVSGAYIALNVTSWELSQLDSSVVALYNVPAINATIECESQNVSNLRVDLWDQTNKNGFTLEIDMFETADGPVRGTGWTVEVPAPLTVFQDGAGVSTTSLDVLGYKDEDDETSMYIGSMGGVIGAQQRAWIDNNTKPVSSPFGQIQPQPFVVSDTGSCTQGNNCNMLIWGMKCTVRQRQGFVNLTRTPEEPTWNKSSSSWSTDVFVRPSKLRSLARQLGTQSFKYMKAGLGPALTPAAETCNSSAFEDANSEMCSQPGPQHLNYQTLAHNLLWAEMAVQTVAFETGAMNASLATPDMFITVPSTASVQRYRITYIPALLFGGMICVFVAALIAASLQAYTANTASGRQFRYVDSLRLLVDCAISLQNEKLHPDARTWSNQELLDWAQNYMVRYESHAGHDGSLQSSTVVVTPVVSMTTLTPMTPMTPATPATLLEKRGSEHWPLP